MNYDVETIIIGAGVIGLAIGRELANRRQDVLILEKNSQFGEETSSRNSEVIHAGIYYPKDSLKARFCVEGKKLLYTYCQERSLPHAQIGKLIIATDETELPVLQQIKEKAEANGVFDLEVLDSHTALRLEPALTCVGALRSPSTGIIDTHQYMLSLVGDIETNGGTIAYNSPFNTAAALSGGFRVTSGSTKLTCKSLINSAGLGAQTVASNINGLASAYIPQRYMTKGSYFTMATPNPFRQLIYPVPNTASLGVHVTLDMAGQIRFGPDQEWVDHIDYQVDPARANHFYEAIRRYYPALPDNALLSAYSGIRPKVQGPTDPMKDFGISTSRVHGINGLVNLFGMESPGLTASLKIASHVGDILSKS